MKKERASGRLRGLALAVVALHALVLLGHDAAHRGLGVALAPWQTAYAYLVIVAAPIVAAVLLFTRFARGGYLLLAASMLGALLFGVYHHYVLVSPDHVAHLPAGGEQPLFRFTAAAMAVVESAGLALGLWAARR